MRRLPFILFLLAGTCGFAQERLTFEEAMSLALSRNHQVTIARNNAKIASNSANIGNAGLLPGVSLTGGTTYQEGGSAMSSEGATTTSGSVSANYTFFDGLGTIYRFKRLQAGKVLGEADARALIESTLLGVSSAFYAAASAYENVQIAEELLAISQERVKRARNRSQFGRAGAIDVLAARVDLIADSVTVVEARLFWDESRRNLNVLLNRTIDHPFEIDTGVSFGTVHNLEVIKEAAAQRNAALLSAAARLRQARFDLGSAKAAHFPRLDLSASYGYSQTASGWDLKMNDPSRSVRVGATFNFNLFNGFQTSIQRQNSALALRNSELNYELEQLNLEKEVISAYETYKNTLLVMDLESRNVEAAELNFQRTEELYGLGQVTTTQFREAQLNLIRARTSLSSSKYNAKMSEIELLRLSGQLLQE